MHVDYVDDHSQSVSSKVPKSQFDTLECTLDELAVLELIYKNPSIKQKELVSETGKSLSTVKWIMESLQKKEYIRRVDGKRYGKWEVMIWKYPDNTDMEKWYDEQTVEKLKRYIVDKSFWGSCTK